jgi:hypothetical protein
VASSLATMRPLLRHFKSYVRTLDFSFSGRTKTDSTTENESVDGKVMTDLNKESSYVSKNSERTLTEDNVQACSDGFPSLQSEAFSEESNSRTMS